MARKINKDSVAVYSTDQGRISPDCCKPTRDCVSSQKRQTTIGDGIVRISLEKKGRKGKGVTLLTGVPVKHAELPGLAKKLKQKCGSGGTVKNGSIEIQGDHRDSLMEEMKKLGYTVKRSGG